MMVLLFDKSMERTKDIVELINNKQLQLFTSTVFDWRCDAFLVDRFKSFFSAARASSNE